MEPETLLFVAPLEGQLVYFFVALVQVTGYMMMVFKFRAADANGNSFYDSIVKGQLSEVTLWKYANLVLSFSKVTLFG